MGIYPWKLEHLYLMPKPCATCHSPLRADIEKMAIQGKSYKEIEKFCKDRNFQISYISIKNHMEKHVEGYVPRTFATHKKSSVDDYDIEQQILPYQDTDPRFIDPIALRKELGCPEEIKDASELADTAKRFIGEICLNQLAIVLNMQRAFMTGKRKYPNDEMRGLNQIIEIIGAITNRDSSRPHFNLDKALDFSQDSDTFRDELLNKVDETLRKYSG